MSTLVIDSSMLETVAAVIDDYGVEIEVFRGESCFLHQTLYKWDYPISDVVLGIGPGSYTGIRVGCVTAQVLAYVRGVNIYAVNSLKGLVPVDYDCIDSKFACVRYARGAGYYCVTGVRVHGVTSWSDVGVVDIENINSELSNCNQIFTYCDIPVLDREVCICTIEPLSLLRFAREDVKKYNCSDLFSGIKIDYSGGNKSRKYGDSA